MAQPSWKSENEGLWHQVFASGHPVLSSKQRRYSLLPGAPRCKLCEVPFGGVGGFVMRFRGLHASSRNPNYCNACDGFLQAFPGGAEVPMSMLMVDIRGSVQLSNRLAPAEFAQQVIATRGELHEIFNRNDAFVLEYQGDSVFAVWPPGFVGPRHAALALTAARQIAAMGASRSADKPAVGASAHSGNVYIGTIPDAGGQMAGFGAFGADVNMLGRLTHAAQPGEVLVSRTLFELAGEPLTGSLQRIQLKGFDEPAEVVSLGSRGADAAA